MKKEIKEQIVLNEIVEDLKQFKHSNLHQCPYCDEVFEWNDADYNPEENTYTCPQCRETFDENELQKVNFIDYIQEMFLVYQRSKNNDANTKKY